MISGRDETRNNQPLSVSVRTQCEWAWYWLSGRTYTIYIYVYSDKHTNTCEEIKSSPPNLSEGGLLRSPIKYISCEGKNQYFKGICVPIVAPLIQLIQISCTSKFAMVLHAHNYMWYTTD